MASFNLIDERWIPCVRSGAAVPEWLGLRETLARAHEIQEIADPSPLITVSLHRLLLAILHRNFGPRNASEWGKLWEAGRWDTETLDRYFETWRGRFDLFDELRPFYQVSDLEPQYAGTITKLTHELASPGNAATLFDHTSVDSAALTPAQAARYLLACQSFHVGGLMTHRKAEPANPFKYADASPLTKGAVTLVRGRILFETLMLNLHQYSHESQEPFPMSEDDAPAWERHQETAAGDRHLKGYLDLLTWQSRRIRLFPEVTEDGSLVVPRVALMKGFQFPGAGYRFDRETMLAFRRNEQAKGDQDPWPAVGFEEERALWRDSTALFQSTEERQARPKTLSWLRDLMEEGYLDQRLTLPLELYGLTTSKANVLLWRREVLPLPLIYLEDEDIHAVLRTALGIAEDVGRLLRPGIHVVEINGKNVKLPTPMQVLGDALEGGTGGRRADPEAVRQLVRHFGTGRAYWSQLEPPFRRFVVDLAEDRTEDKWGEVVYGRTAMPQWTKAVERAARTAFQEATDSLDTSARALRAAALARREFERRLHGILGRHREEEADEGEVAV